MTSLPHVLGGLHTPGVGSLPANPAPLSSPHISPAGVSTLQQQRAQQALYRDISTSIDSICRPLTHSAVTNRYTSDAGVPLVTSPVVPQVVRSETPSNRFIFASQSHGVHTAPAASEGYFRDPFTPSSYPPFFGPNQLYFSSACHPRDMNHPFRVYPPPPPHGLAAHPVSSYNWQPRMDPTPEHVSSSDTSAELFPDLISQVDEIPKSHNVGCQVEDLLGGSVPSFHGSPAFPSQYYPVFSSPPGSSVVSPPIVVKDASKLNIPVFNDKKTTWANYAPKLRAALLECNMSFLLNEESTTAANAAQSKELMLQFFKKLEGSAAKLFTSMEAEQFYMEGGRGIEMFRLLASTFNPLDDEAVREIIKNINTHVLEDSQDLSSYFDAITDWNAQLSWVGQSFPVTYLIQLAVSQLSKSRFAKQLESLQFFHTAAKTSFTSLYDIKEGLTRLDPARGLSTVAVVTPSPSGKKQWTKHKGGVQEGLVSSVTDAADDIVMHSLAWIGAIDLSDQQVQKIKSDFKCWLCRTNGHSWPNCSHLTKWEIKKKPDARPRGRTSPTGAASATSATEGVQDGTGSSAASPADDLLGAANSVRFPDIDTVTQSTALLTVDDNRFAPLASVVDSDDESSVVDDVVFDHVGNSELLLEDVEMLADAVGVTVTSGNGSLYFSDSTRCLGSARAVRVSSIPVDCRSLIPASFPVVADSGATNSMVPWKELFIDYKKCSTNSYVLLANNQKAPCLGRGTIKIQLGGVIVVISNVLHVPSLRCPLYSIRCHSRIPGCAFHADNKGVILAFPEFTLPVDISSDCIIKGVFPSPSGTVRFDERLVGLASAVSDNTRNRHKRRGIVVSPTSLANCQETSGDSPDVPLSSTLNTVESPAPSPVDPPVSTPSDSIIVEDVKDEESDDKDNDFPPLSIDDDLSANLLDNDFLHKLVEEMGLDRSLADSMNNSSLSQKQIGEIAKACVDTLRKHGRITPELFFFYPVMPFLLPMFQPRLLLMIAQIYLLVTKCQVQVLLIDVSWFLNCIVILVFDN
jgi:hypothetical protein